MTTLVTGATGFAGVNIVRALAKAGEQVVALDITRASAEFGFSPRYDLRRGLESYLEWARDYEEVVQ